MYESPIIAVANYHKISGLIQTQLLSYSSLKQKSDIGFTKLKAKCVSLCSFTRTLE